MDLVIQHLEVIQGNLGTFLAIVFATGSFTASVATWVLRAQVGGLNATNETLREQRDGATRDRDVLRGERDALRERYDVLQKKLDQCTRALRALEASNESESGRPEGGEDSSSPVGAVDEHQEASEGPGPFALGGADTHRQHRPTPDDLQHRVLQYLASMPNEHPWADLIAEGLRVNQVRTEHALDRLLEQGLVGNTGSLSGIRYYLTKRGREYLVVHDLL